jgi:hypothetical protein
VSTNIHDLKKAVLYIRVSGDDQAKKGYSLLDQLEALRVWAAKENYEVLEEVVDDGWSGAYLERPGMDRVRDLVAAGGVGIVAALFRHPISRRAAAVAQASPQEDDLERRLQAAHLRGGGGAGATSGGRRLGTEQEVRDTVVEPLLPEDASGLRDGGGRE